MFVASVVGDREEGLEMPAGWPVSGTCLMEIQWELGLKSSFSAVYPKWAGECVETGSFCINISASLSFHLTHRNHMA